MVSILKFILVLAMYLLPIHLTKTTLAKYKLYKRKLNLCKIKSSGLQIHFNTTSPDDISLFKLEKIIELLHKPLKPPKNFIDKIKHKFDYPIEPYFTLEIISHSGRIYYNIYSDSKTISKIKELFKIYHPNIHITEISPNIPVADDSKISYTQFKLSEDEFLPIDTYVDLELDTKEPKSIAKMIDPINRLIATIAPTQFGEIIILALSCRAITRTYKTKKDGKTVTQSLQDQIKDKLKSMEESVGELDPKKPVVDQLKESDRELYKKLKRHLNKKYYDTVIRITHVTPPGIESYISSLDDIFSDFNGENSFKKANDSSLSVNLFRSINKTHNLFYTPKDNNTYTPLNTEEIVTIFRPPKDIHMANFTQSFTPFKTENENK